MILLIMAKNYRFFLRHPETFQLFEHQQQFVLDERDEPEIVFQLIKVLRVKPGDTVTLLPSGAAVMTEYVFDVAASSKRGVELTLKERHPNGHELDGELGLLLCLPNKPEKLELIVQKAVEIGATRIDLVHGDFSQMKHQLRPERLQKILMEAAEQSERGTVPVLQLHGQLTDFLTALAPEERNSLAVAMERSHGANTLNDLSGKTGRRITVLVGPEGGFSDTEKTLIDQLQIRTFSLGKRVLRMETAAILSLGMAALQLESNSRDA